MDNIELYINRISKLANRNKELNREMNEIVGRYNFIQKQNDKYLSLLSNFSFEEEDKKVTPRKKIRRFKRASLLYASIEGFHKLSGHPNAEKLMDKLDELQLRMGDIAKKYDIIKIKTVGDIFIFGGGMLEENRTNPIDVILAAIEMQQAAIEINGGEGGTAFWELSIGIHTGPVLAEPTGRKSTPFRLAGDSVNFTSRLGKACKAGSINISAMTYELVKEFFECCSSGEMPVKYKGFMESFYVDRLLPEFVKEGTLFGTNNSFNVKYSLIQFLDIQEEVLDMLEQNLPEYLFYHNIKHTIDVVTEVELIGWAEGLSEEEILILKLAGLFHDAGHVISYEDHEFHGTVLARKMLKKYHYAPEILDRVCALIMATQFPPEPQNLLEKVMCDSDLDYLGRADFIPVSNMLYEELKVRNMVGSFTEWNIKQLTFIRKHQYFTDTAQNLREVNKNKQIERLERLLEVGAQGS
ncbi:adenylate/guanylate cyclase domain-containing protein [Plebeiibacterium marinum]|uniref:HD domain-containing protein n=1 Tax=Plebeiibacterium marinum TaxID=2992111 RepID=A0AAE3MDJ6_9BACT|nr:adenylate/guanylate cyclase domain-containing protein [Plebeiobacterium marinum]MCW3805968.1 HD domain-containing protein [Plebeiobacterium marinum]